MKHKIDNKGVYSEGPKDGSSPVFIPSLASSISKGMFVRNDGLITTSGSAAFTGSFSGSFSGNGADLAFDFNSWTPNFVFQNGGNPSYASRNAYYYRIGKLVVANFDISMSNKDSISGSCYMAPLPYLAMGNIGTSAGSVSIGIFNNIATGANNVTNITGHVDGGTYSASLHMVRNNISANEALDANNFTNTTRIQGTIIYLTHQTD